MRKNVTWIVSALLIFAFAAFGVGRPAGNASAAKTSADSDFTIQAVEQTESDLTVSMTNRAAATASLLCAAAYDKDGRMLSVSAENYTLNASQTARIAVSLPEGAPSVKAFVLDASTLNPLRTAWELKTLIDRFCAFNGQIQRKRMKSALLSVACNSDGWTFDALEAHYKTLVRYLNFRDV